jgi:hypothetical protein
MLCFVLFWFQLKMCGIKLLIILTLTTTIQVTQVQSNELEEGAFGNRTDKHGRKYLLG